MALNSQIFNPSRFSLTLRGEILTNWRPWLMTYGVILGSMLGLILYITWMYDEDASAGYVRVDPMWVAESVIFTIGSIITACISGAAVFSSLKSKGGRINDLMLPASQLEKYISRWLIMVPICFIAFWGGAIIVDALRCLFTLIFFPAATTKLIVGNLLSDTLVGNCILVYFMVNSLFLLGASIWPRRAILITFLVCALIAFIYLVFNKILAMTFLAGASTPPLRDITEGGLKALWYCGSILFILVNYTVAYFRYTEIEIIQRW